MISRTSHPLIRFCSQVCSQNHLPPEGKAFLICNSYHSLWQYVTEKQKKAHAPHYYSFFSFQFSIQTKRQASFRTPAIFISVELLEFNLSTGSLELLLESLSIFLRDAFLNSLGSAVNNSLSFLQTKTGSLTDSLDNSDLTGARGLEDNVKLSLLLSSSSAVACTGSSNCNSSSSGYAKLILYSVYEISELENCEAF